MCHPFYTPFVEGDLQQVRANEHPNNMHLPLNYSNATTFDAPIDATPTDSATDGNQFRLTGTEWHFNLSTKGLGNTGQGIWLLKATLFDGSTYSVWVAVKK